MIGQVYRLDGHKYEVTSEPIKHEDCFFYESSGKDNEGTEFTMYWIMNKETKELDLLDVT